MTVWIIALAITAAVLLIATITLAKSCLDMLDNINKLERQNDNLRYTVKNLKTQMDGYRAPYNTDAEKLTALRFSLHQKNEEIEALREKLRRQNQLLKQKWGEAKKCG